jgi:hypothetical protein
MGNANKTRGTPVRTRLEHGQPLATVSRRGLRDRPIWEARDFQPVGASPSATGSAACGAWQETKTTTNPDLANQQRGCHARRPEATKHVLYLGKTNIHGEFTGCPAAEEARKGVPACLQMTDMSCPLLQTFTTRCAADGTHVEAN